MGKRRRYGITPIFTDRQLEIFFALYPSVRLALLFGSRATGKATATSDYDFALLFTEPATDPWGHVAVMRSELTAKLGLPDEDFDLVDLANADSAVLSGIAVGYRLLKGSPDELQRILSKN